MGVLLFFLSDQLPIAHACLGYGNNTLADAFVWSTELYDVAEFSDTQKDVFM